MNGTAKANAPNRADVPLHPWRWTKRLAVGYALLAVLLPVSWWVWARTADARLRAAEAEARAQGFAVTAAQLNHPPLPAERNGAAEIEAAAAALPTLTSAQNNWIPGPRATPWTEADVQTARAIVAAGQPALQHLAQAAQRGGGDWDIDYTRLKPGFFPSARPGLTMGKLRQLANFLDTAARLSLAEGDERGAATDLERLPVLAQAAVEPYALISSLVASAIEAMRCRDWWQLAWTLQVAPKDGAGDGRKLDEATVRGIIAGLLERRGPHYYRGAFAGEYRVFVGATSYFGPSDPSFPAPLITCQRAAYLRALLPLARATQAAAWPEGHALSIDPALRRRLDRTRSLADVYSWLLERIFLPSADKAVELEFRMDAERQMTALALAIHLYACDHGGAFPARLEELVPDYIARLPRDLFAPNDRTYGYIPGGDLPRLYSVGPDMTDEGGAITVPAQPGETIRNWAQEDGLVFLRRPPVAPAATAPASADPEGIIFDKLREAIKGK